MNGPTWLPGIGKFAFYFDIGFPWAIPLVDLRNRFVNLAYLFARRWPLSKFRRRKHFPAGFFAAPNVSRKNREKRAYAINTRSDLLLSLPLGKKALGSARKAVLHFPLTAILGMSGGINERAWRGRYKCALVRIRYETLLRLPWIVKKWSRAIFRVSELRKRVENIRVREISEIGE